MKWIYKFKLWCWMGFSTFKNTFFPPYNCVCVCMIWFLNHALSFIPTSIHTYISSDVCFQPASTLQYPVIRPVIQTHQSNDLNMFYTPYLFPTIISDHNNLLLQLFHLAIHHVLCSCIEELEQQFQSLLFAFVLFHVKYLKQLGRMSLICGAKKKILSFPANRGLF